MQLFGRTEGGARRVADAPPESVFGWDRICLLYRSYGTRRMKLVNTGAAAPHIKMVYGIASATAGFPAGSMPMVYRRLFLSPPDSQEGGAECCRVPVAPAR